MQLRFKSDADRTLYEDDRVAVELGNYEDGATIYVYHKLETGTLFRRYPIGELVELEDAEKVADVG